MGLNPVPSERQDTVQVSSWGCILWLRLPDTISHLLRSPLCWPGDGGGTGEGIGNNMDVQGLLSLKASLGHRDCHGAAWKLSWKDLLPPAKKTRFPTLSVSVTWPKVQQTSSFPP